MTVLFWLAVLAIAFSYVGYPIVLAASSAVRNAFATLRFLGGGPDRRSGQAETPWPRVTIAFAAFDEEACIRQKIENCLAVDYPADRLEVLVGCDGCTDRTAEIARAAGDERVRVVELAPRAGKASVLSRIVPTAGGDVVVLTDANVMLDRNAVRALVRRFRDPEVGAVVGRLRLVDPHSDELGESLYWRYETFLKHLEGEHGYVLGANGGLYAIRRVLFTPLPPDTITDDFVIPLHIAVRGWRVPFEPGAVAIEETTEDAVREFARRARIGAGNWQALLRVPHVLDPRAGFLFFAFASHKLVRWSTPLLLAIALVANGVLAVDPGGWYRVLLAGQVAFYAGALGGWRGRDGWILRSAGLAHHFVAMNAALAVGFWRFARGTQSAAWQRTERPARADAA